MDERTLKLKGSILGVSFEVTAKNTGPHDLHFQGEAWGMPVDVKIGVDHNTDILSASGTLLGNEFTITGTVAD